MCRNVPIGGGGHWASFAGSAAQMLDGIDALCAMPEKCTEDV